MRLDVRVPLTYARGALSGRGISTSVANQSIRFEASIDAPAGAKLEIELELLGSGRKLEFRAKVLESSTIEGRPERLVHVGDFEMSAEDLRSYSAWLVERAPLVVRTAPEASAGAVRGALFEVSADFSEVTVAWPTRAAYSRTFRDELSRKVLRVRNAAAVPFVGASTRVTMLIPHGVPTQIVAKVSTAQRGDVELSMQFEPEVAERLAAYAQ